VVEAATAGLTGRDLGLGDLPAAELDTLFDVLERVRRAAGDVAAG
jgi:hypothetical protein